MNYNDDDWYEFNPVTQKIVRSYSPRAFRYQATPIVLENGNQVVKGMRAKGMDLTF